MPRAQRESEDNEKHTETQGERCCCSSARNKNMKNIFGIEEAQEQRAEEPGGVLLHKHGLQTNSPPPT